jgi:hypothetical protein
MANKPMSKSGHQFKSPLEEEKFRTQASGQEHTLRPKTFDYDALLFLTPMRQFNFQCSNGEQMSTVSALHAPSYAYKHS